MSHRSEHTVSRAEAESFPIVNALGRLKAHAGLHSIGQAMALLLVSQMQLARRQGTAPVGQDSKGSGTWHLPEQPHHFPSYTEHRMADCQRRCWGDTLKIHTESKGRKIMAMLVIIFS